MIIIDKYILQGDGIDAVMAQITGRLENGKIVYSVNGIPYTASPDFQTPIPGIYSATVQISCDTPNISLFILQGNEIKTIYVIGAP